jgi:hypothetical protein
MPPIISPSSETTQTASHGVPIKVDQVEKEQTHDANDEETGTGY